MPTLRPSLPIALAAVVAAVGAPARPTQLFVPLPPCRIVDTRVAGGILDAGELRAFQVAGSTGFEAQGGKAGGCGVPQGTGVPKALAAAINVVAVRPAAPGHLTAWAHGSPQPEASILNYSPTAGPAIANGLIVPIAGVAGAPDLDVVTAAGVHVVIDVTGYFLGLAAGTGLQATGDGPLTLSLRDGYQLPQRCAPGDFVLADEQGDWQCLQHVDDDTTYSTGGGGLALDGTTFSIPTNTFWRTNGNAGTVAGTHFLGTTDATAVDVRANNLRIARFEPNPASPNVVIGHHQNAAGAAAFGATVVGGGEDARGNTATGNFATVTGGSANNATAERATIGGGEDNNAGGIGSTIAGGYINTIVGPATSSTIGGGQQNETSGFGSTVPGGYFNEATASYAFAAGQRAVADDAGSFVWNDQTFTVNLQSPAPNTFSARASGGFFLGAGAVQASIPAGRFLNTTTGAHLTTTGVWTNNSDRNAKTDLRPVDGRAVLERLAALPITSWRYRNGDSRHIGPMAQDFHAAFGLGQDDVSIGTVDADGVALAAIQGLHREVRERDARIAALETRLHRLTTLVVAALGTLAVGAVALAFFRRG